MGRPSIPPDWSTGANYSSGPAIGTPTRVAPSGGQIVEGFEPSSRPPAQFHNSIFGNHGDWINYTLSAQHLRYQELWLTPFDQSNTTSPPTGTNFQSNVSANCHATVAATAWVADGASPSLRFSSTNANVAKQSIIYTNPIFINAPNGNASLGFSAIFQTGVTTPVGAQLEIGFLQDPINSLAGGQGAIFLISNGNNWAPGAAGSSTVYAPGPTSVSGSAWHQFLIQITPAQLTFFIDGNQVGSTTTVTDFPDAATQQSLAFRAVSVGANTVLAGSVSPFTLDYTAVL